MKKSKFSKSTLLLICLNGIMLVPVGILVLYSFTPAQDEVTFISLNQFRQLFLDSDGYFILYFRSLLISFGITYGQTAVSAAVGFLLGKFTFRGRVIIMTLYTIVLFLPYSATLLPNYIVLREIGLLNTQASLIIPAVLSPLGGIIMAIFIHEVPQEILDSALLETKSLFRIFRSIILPQIRPAIALVFLLTFTEVWSMVEQPQALMENTLLHPLSVSLNSIFQEEDTVNFAGSLLYLLPPFLLLYVFEESLAESVIVEKRRRVKIKCSLGKMIIWVLLISFVLACSTPVIRYYSLPKVYTISQNRGKVGGEKTIYECVVPRSTVGDDATLWMAYSRETILGAQYFVYEKQVRILAEDELNIAVDLGNVNSEHRIVIACEGELTYEGDVILIN